MSHDVFSFSVAWHKHRRLSTDIYKPVFVCLALMLIFASTSWAVESLFMFSWVSFLLSARLGFNHTRSRLDPPRDNYLDDGRAVVALRL